MLLRLHSLPPPTPLPRSRQDSALAAAAAHLPAFSALLRRVWEDDHFLMTANFDAMGIGDEGARSVGEALLENRHVSMLWLNENKIGPGGALAIACSLASKNNVTEVRGK